MESTLVILCIDTLLLFVCSHSILYFLWERVVIIYWRLLLYSWFIVLSDITPLYDVWLLWVIYYSRTSIFLSLRREEVYDLFRLLHEQQRLLVYDPSLAFFMGGAVSQWACRSSNEVCREAILNIFLLFPLIYYRLIGHKRVYFLILLNSQYRVKPSSTNWVLSLALWWAY